MSTPRWGAVEERPLPWAPVPGRETTSDVTAPAGTVPPADRLADPTDGPPVEHRSPYTWLQVLGLISVAFVLGVLIYFALIQDDDGGTGAALSAAVGGVPVSTDGASAVAHVPFTPSHPFETGA
ncbi:hypothetical protein [Actinotalea sp. Marseille-Q4924]|uniref:hypothetical protein n=1 Tax=Actinotalea sp. Marseille-Q4924 TaxID=2866571 RepID=UPI001CE4AC90|nr:hypothetical protein [Actinotalea sp. Marseille-Q4924]